MIFHNCWIQIKLFKYLNLYFSFISSCEIIRWITGSNKACGQIVNIAEVSLHHYTTTSLLYSGVKPQIKLKNERQKCLCLLFMYIWWENWKWNKRMWGRGLIYLLLLCKTLGGQYHFYQEASYFCSRFPWISLKCHW